MRTLADVSATKLLGNPYPAQRRRGLLEAAGLFSLMREKSPSSGVIVNILDKGALEPWVDFAHHGISKAGLLALTKATAAGCAPDIRANRVTDVDRLVRRHAQHLQRVLEDARMGLEVANVRAHHQRIEAAGELQVMEQLGRLP